jgi:hypothetical protein
LHLEETPALLESPAIVQLRLYSTVHSLALASQLRNLLATYSSWRTSHPDHSHLARQAPLLSTLQLLAFPW